MKNKYSVLIQRFVNYIMSRRVTIMIEGDLDKKIRLYQSKKIQKENSTYSYSRVVNDIIRRNI